jgi:hypothetical protein
VLVARRFQRRVKRKMERRPGGAPETLAQTPTFPPVNMHVTRFEKSSQARRSRHRLVIQLRSKTMSQTKSPALTTRTPSMCGNFSGDPGDPVQWQGVPANGCTISQDGTKTWPFNLASPISLPASSQITIKAGLSSGKYYFLVSCCTSDTAPHTVDVG